MCVAILVDRVLQYFKEYDMGDEYGFVCDGTKDNYDCDCGGVWEMVDKEWNEYDKEWSIMMRCCVCSESFWSDEY